MSGPWRFSSQSASGDIAVVEGGAPLGGVNTGFADILYLDTTEPSPPSKFSGKESVLLWSGVKSNGKWGIGLLPLDHGGQVDQSEMIIISQESHPGEAWFSCGIAGGFLYVLDAAGGTVLRLASSSTGCFDLRDSTFSVTIPEGMWAPVRHIVDGSDLGSRYVVELIHHGALIEHLFVVQSGGGYAFEAEVPADLPVTRVHLRGDFCAGMQQVAVQGPVGHAISIETSSAADGPGTRVSSQDATVDRSGFLLVDIDSPLVQGEYVRVYDATDGAGRPPVRVVGARPSILGIVPVKAGEVQAGERVTIHGGGWGSDPSVLLHETSVDTATGRGSVAPHRLAIVSSSQREIVVDMPSVVGKGFLTVADNSGAVTTYNLTLVP